MQEIVGKYGEIWKIQMPPPQTIIEELHEKLICFDVATTVRVDVFGYLASYKYGSSVAKAHLREILLTEVIEYEKRDTELRRNLLDALFGSMLDHQ